MNGERTLLKAFSIYPYIFLFSRRQTSWRDPSFSGGRRSSPSPGEALVILIYSGLMKVVVE